jgi:hypothetical protein
MAELPEVTSQTVSAIWSAVEAAQERDERHYLGASVLGNDCSRRLWYGFRWAHEPETFDGRKLSIFQSGHLWEDRLIGLLRGAGVAVDPVDPETGQQWLVRFAGGHAGGHLDGLAYKVPEAPKTRHVVEAKSHNHKSFTALRSGGVQKSKPLHFAQMQLYMHGTGYQRALYIAVNKNDDEIHTERVSYDHGLALQLVTKAERIVTAERPPAKLHEDPNAKMARVCNYCPAKGVCHDGAFARRNCRTCLHATAHLDGDARWSCDRFKRDLTREEQAAGCPRHLFIPDLVPGEQVDADEVAEAVTYRLHTGELWTDGTREVAEAAA